MAEYLTVAEIYQMQHRLIDMFGGLHGVRDKGAVEAAVFRPQTGYYNSLEEEAAALMESLANNYGFLDGNKRIASTASTSKSKALPDMNSSAARWIAMNFASREFWIGSSAIANLSSGERSKPRLLTNCRLIRAVSEVRNLVLPSVTS